MNIHDIYDVIFRVWRKRRFQKFLDVVKPTLTDTLLDVGGYPKFWTQYPPCVSRIDSLNLDEQSFDRAQFPQYNINCLAGDGCAMSMENGSYDIVFSNSVIEHVGDWERQQQFARELRRVGSRLWVQTPAFACPIEPHFLAPFVHWLPVSIRRRVLRYLTPWGWLEKPDQAAVDRTIDSTRLLTKSQMKSLFPDCQILTERLFWLFPKSYVAVRQSDGTDHSMENRAVQSLTVCGSADSTIRR
jgi:hypothetical protein